MHKSSFYVIFAVFLFPVLLPSAEPLAEKTQPAEPSGPTGVKKISPTLSVDHDHDLVILEAEIVLRDAPLELLLCPKRTKEHESILAAEVEPKQFQLALLMIGAQPGRPATFQPLRPPTGQRLKIWCEYDQDGRRELIDARQWLRNIQTKKSPAANFVFAGSQFRQLPGGRRVFAPLVGRSFVS